MLFVPYVGVPLYLLLGGRKIKRVAARKRSLYRPISYTQTSSSVSPVERLLLSSGVPSKVSGNAMEMLSSGEEAYRALTQLLQSARKRIHVSTFIFQLDSVGCKIAEILEGKAREGVEVRLLLDGLGSLWTFPWRLGRFRKAGGRVSVFLPFFHVPFFGHANLRNHRKLVIVDGREGIVGGMNIAQSYMGPMADPKRWVDLSMKIQGPITAAFEEIFRQDWNFASGETLQEFQAPDENVEVLAPLETMQVVASGPDVSGDPLYDSITSAIFSAKKRVWIATPYFIPDETLSKALELAARRGVDVRLLLPEKSNHALADLCRTTYTQQLMTAGSRVQLLQNKMMHAKVLVVDDVCAVVGSANLDMRSLLLNYEVGLFIYSDSGIQSISQWFESVEISTKPARFRSGAGFELLGGLGRILGPVL